MSVNVQGTQYLCDFLWSRTKLFHYYSCIVGRRASCGAEKMKELKFIESKFLDLEYILKKYMNGDECDAAILYSIIPKVCDYFIFLKKADELFKLLQEYMDKFIRGEENVKLQKILEVYKAVILSSQIYTKMKIFSFYLRNMLREGRYTLSSYSDFKDIVKCLIRFFDPDFSDGKKWLMNPEIYYHMIDTDYSKMIFLLCFVSVIFESPLIGGFSEFNPASFMVHIFRMLEDNDDMFDKLKDHRKFNKTGSLFEQDVELPFIYLTEGEISYLRGGYVKLNKLDRFYQTIKQLPSDQVKLSKLKSIGQAVQYFLENSFVRFFKKPQENEQKLEEIKNKNVRSVLIKDYLTKDLDFKCVIITHHVYVHYFYTTDEDEMYFLENFFLVNINGLDDGDYYRFLLSPTFKKGDDYEEEYNFKERFDRISKYSKSGGRIYEHWNRLVCDLESCINEISDKNATDYDDPIHIVRLAVEKTDVFEKDRRLRNVLHRKIEKIISHYDPKHFPSLREILDYLRIQY